MTFLNEVSRMSRKDAIEAYENLKLVAAARVQKQKEISSLLFNNPSQLNAVQQKGKIRPERDEKHLNIDDIKCEFF